MMKKNEYWKRRAKKLEEELFYKVVSIEKSENKIRELAQNLLLNQRIITSIIGAKNLQQVTKSLLGSLKKNMRLDEIAILLFNAEKNALVHFASVGLTPKKTRTEFHPGEGVSGVVFMNNRKMLIDRVGQHPLFRHWGVRSDFYRNKTFLSLPLEEKGGPIGVINVCGDAIPDEYVNNFSILATTLTPVLHLKMIKEKQEQEFYNLIKKIMDFAEVLNPYTYGHSYRVHLYSMFIADLVGSNSGNRETLSKGSRLHDIGKIAIMDIVKKTHKLTREEIEILKMHPVLGVEFVKDFEFLSDTIPIIKYHHERIDGRGYPGELRGKEIPLGARIVAVADTYDAITSGRTYRARKDIEYAIRELKSVSGSQLDSDIVKAFLGDKSLLYKITLESYNRVNEEFEKDSHIRAQLSRRRKKVIPRERSALLSLLRPT